MKVLQVCADCQIYTGFPMNVQLHKTQRRVLISFQILNLSVSKGNSKYK